MKKEYLIYPAQFFTATIYEWKTMLADEKHKEIIINSLHFLVNKKRMELNAFVIINNHLHLIWQSLRSFTPSQNQASFMKYTAQQLMQFVIKNDKRFLFF